MSSAQEVKIHLELVIDARMLKFNSLKAFLFKVYCFLSFGIIYLLNSWYGVMKSYPYDLTENFDEADSIILTFKNNAVEIVKIRR